MKRRIVYLLTMLMVLINGSVLSVQASVDYPFHPDCTYSATPPAGWTESFDFDDKQNYCTYTNNTLWIESPVKKNFLGQYFTDNPADIWNTLSLTEQGNVRDVRVRIEYFAPMYQGVCVHSSINGGSGLYNSPQSFLVANHNTGFHEEATFDDAFRNTNNIMTCEQWNVIDIPVKNLQNDFGSSFAGQSKTIGSFGFEMTNLYIRDVKIVGTTETIDLW